MTWSWELTNEHKWSTFSPKLGGPVTPQHLWLIIIASYSGGVFTCVFKKKKKNFSIKTISKLQKVENHKSNAWKLVRGQTSGLKKQTPPAGGVICYRTHKGEEAAPGAGRGRSGQVGKFNSKQKGRNSAELGCGWQDTGKGFHSVFAGGLWEMWKYTKPTPCPLGAHSPETVLNAQSECICW